MQSNSSSSFGPFFGIQEARYLEVDSEDQWVRLALTVRNEDGSESEYEVSLRAVEDGSGELAEGYFNSIHLSALITNKMGCPYTPPKTVSSDNSLSLWILTLSTAPLRVA